MQFLALKQDSPPSSLPRARLGCGTLIRRQVVPFFQVYAVFWTCSRLPAKPIARQNLAVGHATSSRAEMGVPAGPLAVTIRQEEPFQASARLAGGPRLAEWSPTNRQLVGEAQETSLAKILTPCDGLGTDLATQLPPLNISDRPGV